MIHSPLLTRQTRIETALAIPSSKYFVLTDPVANDEFLGENLVDEEENLIIEEVLNKSYIFR